MLEDYCQEQKLAYEIMINEIKSNHLSHAYLIDENNYSLAFDLILKFVCEIIGNKLSDGEREILFKRIYENNYPELKIIEPDGMLIKKKQILDLQQDFSMEAIEGKYRIYIICDADKMRSETANSMLKFLEEPSGNIIAILMTNNYNNMLSTIISRCQIIKLNNDNVMSYQDEYLKLAVDFVKQVENYGIRALVNVQEILFNNVSSKEREKLIVFFDILINIYYDIMKIGMSNKNINYSKYYDDFVEISNHNSLNIILKKIDYLVMAKDSIKYNVNNNLLVDSVIVNLGGMIC